MSEKRTVYEIVESIAIFTYGNAIKTARVKKFIKELDEAVNAEIELRTQSAISKAEKGE